jgi:hypothetical protein
MQAPERDGSAAEARTRLIRDKSRRDLATQADRLLALSGRLDRAGTDAMLPLLRDRARTTPQLLPLLRLLEARSRPA